MNATKSAPTTKENLARINAFYADIQMLMVQLAARFKDEGKHEDINAYKAAIEKELPEGFSIVKMTKRPFGFEFKIGTEAVYNITVSGRNYKWARIA